MLHTTSWGNVVRAISVITLSVIMRADCLVPVSLSLDRGFTRCHNSVRWSCRSPGERNRVWCPTRTGGTFEISQGIQYKHTVLPWIRIRPGFLQGKFNDSDAETSNADPPGDEDGIVSGDAEATGNDSSSGRDYVSQSFVVNRRERMDSKDVLRKSSEADESQNRRFLLELPLDGILLQLVPAVLIAVLGLVLTLVVQIEVNKFDAIGEDDTPVVVTDLLEKR